MLQTELDFDKRLLRHKTGKPCNSDSWITVDKQCKCGSRIRYKYKNLCVPCQRERAFKYSRRKAKRVANNIELSYLKKKKVEDSLRTNHILAKIEKASKAKKEIA